MVQNQGREGVSYPFEVAGCMLGCYMTKVHLYTRGLLGRVVGWSGRKYG